MENIHDIPHNQMRVIWGDDDFQILATSKSIVVRQLGGLNLTVRQPENSTVEIIVPQWEV